MSRRTGKYWDTIIKEPEHELTFDDIESAHPLHMLEMLKEVHTGTIDAYDERTLKDDVKKWNNGFIHIAFQVFGLHTPLRVSIQWEKARRGKEVKYMWSMDYLNIIFDDDTVYGLFGEIYRTLLRSENEIHACRDTYYTHSEMGWHAHESLMSPGEIMSHVYELSLLIGRWNADLTLCGDSDYVAACEGFRRFMVATEFL